MGPLLLPFQLVTAGSGDSVHWLPDPATHHDSIQQRSVYKTGIARARSLLPPILVHLYTSSFIASISFTMASTSSEQGGPLTVRFTNVQAFFNEIDNMMDSTTADSLTVTRMMSPIFGF
jgi:hypothetical protein